MEYFEFEKDVKVLYVTARTFPEGIQEALENIHALVPFSKNRRYFGISRPEGNSGIVYKAAAEELKSGEAALLGCETMILKKDKYYCITINDYMKDLSVIGKTFGEILSQPDLDPEGYCVEWYLDNKQVKCMVRMKTSDFTTVFEVDQTPDEVFAAINNVRGWWSGEIEGITDKPGAEFIYQVPGIHYSVQKITEFSPGKKVAWHVPDANLSFVNDKSEWIGTDIVFEITPKGNKTEVRFTHKGLVPAYECYNDCSNAWGMLINGNLRKLISTGKVQPSPW